LLDEEDSVSLERSIFCETIGELSIPLNNPDLPVGNSVDMTLGRTCDEASTENQDIKERKLSPIRSVDSRVGEHSIFSNAETVSNDIRNIDVFIIHKD